MFDLIYDIKSYKIVYIISDSQIKKLKRRQNQEELDEIIKQKKRLKESY